MPNGTSLAGLIYAAVELARVYDPNAAKLTASYERLLDRLKFYEEPEMEDATQGEIENDFNEVAFSTAPIRSILLGLKKGLIQ